MSCRWHTQIGRFYLFIFRWFNFDDASSFKMLLPTESITISTWTIRAYWFITTLLIIPSSVAFFMIFLIVAPPTSSPSISWIWILWVNTHHMIETIFDGDNPESVLFITVVSVQLRTAPECLDDWPSTLLPKNKSTSSTRMIENEFVNISLANILTKCFTGMDLCLLLWLRWYLYACFPTINYCHAK